MKIQQDQIAFGRTTITYSIVRSPGRQTMAIAVSPDRNVVVRAPKGTRRKKIAHAVSQKAGWIIRQLDERRQRSRPTPKEFVSGESFLYLGRQYKLKVRLRSARPVIPSLMLVAGNFELPLPKRWSAKRRRQEARSLLVAWYREHAREKLSQIADEYAHKLGIGNVSIRVSTMKTRWGSANGNGRIRFDWRIIMARTREVEYVVAHELCHLRHSNHSRAFWRMLGSAMPDYAPRREELAKDGSRYSF